MIPHVKMTNKFYNFNGRWYRVYITSKGIEFIRTGSGLIKKV